MGYSDIESANLVGYTQQEAAQGKFLIIGAGFEAVKGGTAINVYITGATINNGGDIKKIAYEVAKEIDYQVEKRAINLNVGAI